MQFELTRQKLSPGTNSEHRFCLANMSTPAISGGSQAGGLQWTFEIWSICGEYRILWTCLCAQDFSIDPAYVFNYCFVWRRRRSLKVTPTESNRRTFSECEVVPKGRTLSMEVYWARSVPVWGTVWIFETLWLVECINCPAVQNVFYVLNKIRSTSWRTV